MGGTDKLPRLAGHLLSQVRGTLYFWTNKWGLTPRVGLFLPTVSPRGGMSSPCRVEQGTNIAICGCIDLAQRSGYFCKATAGDNRYESRWHYLSTELTGGCSHISRQTY